MKDAKAKMKEANAMQATKAMKVGDAVPEGFVLKVLKMQLILTELTCEVGPGGPHAPEYRCRV
jgi:hypothetical protein